MQKKFPQAQAGIQIQERQQEVLAYLPAKPESADV
jgi:hypothetical protein